MTAAEIAPYLRKRIKEAGGVCIPLMGHEYPDYLVVFESDMYFVAFSPTGQYSQCKYEVVKKLEGLGLRTVIINSRRKVDAMIEATYFKPPADPMRAENLLEVFQSTQAMMRALEKHQAVIREDLAAQGLGITRDLKLTELD